MYRTARQRPLRLALLLLAGGCPAVFPATPAVAQTATVRFDIPRQNLASALSAFSAQSGVSIVAAVSIPNVSAPSVQETLSPTEALSRLLQDTGLTYRFSTANSVTLEAAPAPTSNTLRLGPVRVTDSATGGSFQERSAWAPVSGFVARRSATGTKTDAAIVEVPQVVNIVTADQIEAIGAQTVGQSLRYTPGVYSERTGSIVADDNLTIRGFTARTYVDGTRQPLGNLTSSQIDPYGLERVEILKGPSSVLYGRSAPGGIANLVRKRASNEAKGEVEVLVGSYSRFQGKLDLNAPLSADGAVSGRLTVLARDAETQMNYVDDNRVYVAGTLAWRPSEATDLNLFASWQDDKTGVGSFFAEGTLLDNPNGKVPSSVYLGSSTDGYRREQFLLGYRLDQELGGGLKLRSSVDYTNTTASIQYPLVSGLQDDNRTANRYLGITPEDYESVTIDNSLEYAFDTGPLGHQVLAGLDYLWAKANRDDVPIYFDFDTIDIYNPDNSPGELGDRYTQLYFTQRQYGVYLQDQVAWDRLRVTLGLRYDWAHTDAWTSYASPQETRQRDEKLSGRAGAVYLFDNGFAPFVNYTTSFEPEPGATFEGDLFQPLKGRQFEAGLRYQPPGQNLWVTASAFDIRQNDVLAPDPVNQFFNVQLGEVRSQGVELEAKASLASGFDFTAAYSYTDAEIAESTDPAQVGRKLHFVPPTQASLWADYRFGGAEPVGVTLGGGVRYVGEQEGDANNTPDLRLPSYTIVDARLSLDLARLAGWQEGLTFQLNVNNLFDERYVTGCSSSFYAFCYLGQRRTILGSINYRW